MASPLTTDKQDVTQLLDFMIKVIFNKSFKVIKALGITKILKIFFTVNISVQYGIILKSYKV